MEAFDGTTLKHASWREEDGILFFTDQRVDAAPVSYLPFLDRSGRVGYVVDDRKGNTERLLLEPVPNRHGQMVKVVHYDDVDRLDVPLGVVDVNPEWGYRDDGLPGALSGPVLHGGAPEIAVTYWLTVAATATTKDRINFDGLGVGAGDYRFVPFLDAAGKVGHQVLGPDRESGFVYLIPADSGEELTISVNAGDSMTEDDALLAAYQMTDWAEHLGRNPGVPQEKA